MSGSVPPRGAASRLSRRKAATRSRILAAADELFATRGYAQTSIEDIAAAADVAIRTIYLHFRSKAALQLAYFDDWLDAFVRQILARPVDEPVADTVAAALRGMAAEGWEDRGYREMAGLHPTAALLGDEPSELAGEILRRWVNAQDAIARDARARGGHSPDALEPRARAAAIFAAWVATLLAARDAFEGGSLPNQASGNELGVDILRLLTRAGL